MPKKLTYDEWKAEASTVAEKLLGLGDLFADDDPYDLREDAEFNHRNGVSPRAFVEITFADDLASREYDLQMGAESIEEF